MTGSIVTVRILGRRHVGVVTLTNSRDLVHVAVAGRLVLAHPQDVTALDVDAMPLDWRPTGAELWVEAGHG